MTRQFTGRKLPRGLVRIAKGVPKTKKQRLGFKVKQHQSFGKKDVRINPDRNAGALMPLHPARPAVTEAIILTVQQRAKYNRIYGQLLYGLTTKAKARLAPSLRAQALAEAMS